MSRPPFAKLPTHQLQDAYVSALAAHLLTTPDAEALHRKPLDLALRPPLPRRLRSYLYAATNPVGERSVGDYKSQLMVPGQGRRDVGSFEHLSGSPTVLIGYAYDFDVWILWEADLHDPFAFSTNVQLKAESVYQAAGDGLAVRPKRLRSGATETIIAAHSSKLPDAISLRMTTTAERLARSRP